MSPPPSERRDEPLAPTIERFDPSRHDLSNFACGNPVLDTYIRGTVARDEAQHTAVTYVMVDPDEPFERRRVLGYFTLNSFAFARRQARRRDRDKYLGSYDPIPAVLIGRLALDVTFQGKGLGSALLASALVETLKIRERLGIAAAIVHAIDDAAAAFYEHLGFTRFRDEPMHLYYPLTTFEATLDGF